MANCFIFLRKLETGLETELETGLETGLDHRVGDGAGDGAGDRAGDRAGDGAGDHFKLLSRKPSLGSLRIRISWSITSKKDGDNIFIIISSIGNIIKDVKKGINSRFFSVENHIGA